MAKSNYFIYHSRHYVNRGHRVVTVIAQLDEENVFRASVAICNPEDQFVRKTGVKIATERFEKGEFVAEEIIHKDFKLGSKEMLNACEEIAYKLRYKNNLKGKLILEQEIKFVIK